MNSSPPTPHPHHEDLDGVPSFHELLEAELAPGRPELQPRLLQARPSAPELAQMLPRFNRFEFIGAGGMGMVYKAWQPDLRRWVAVKLLAVNLAEDERALERFRNEASILAQLRHPNIVPVHEFGVEGGLAFLVMEYIEGVSLKHWAEREEARTPRAAAGMMARIARAVGVAHASGITHRDLKPSNILVTRDDEPVIIDFGLAQHAAWQDAARMTQTGELAGTAAYLAPEQVDPRLGEAAAATDVHACGVMAFEILAGSLPRPGALSQVLAQLQTDVLPPRLGAIAPKLPRELEAVCWKAMQRQPRDRYPNGTDLAQDLERFIQGLPVLAKHPGPLRRLWHGLRRRPELAAAGTACLIAIAIAAWSARLAVTAQRESALITEINDCLTAREWTPQTFAEAESLLDRFSDLQPSRSRRLREDMMTRTAAEVAKRLDRRMGSVQEPEHTSQLLAHLLRTAHPQAAELEAEWRAQQTDWQPVAALTAPMDPEAARAIFRPGAWSIANGCVKAEVSSGPNFTSLMLKKPVQHNVTVVAEFAGQWRSAPSVGIQLRLPAQPNTMFVVLHANRFQSYAPKAGESNRLPVMAIMRDSKVLAHAVIPGEVLRAQPGLHLRAVFEAGEMQFTVNDGHTIHFTSVFGLGRALPLTTVGMILPVQAQLRSLDIRQRQLGLQAVPFVKADDLVVAGKPAMALPIYRDFIGRGDSGVEARYKHGYCLEALGRTSEARKVWSGVAGTKIEPWRSLALFQLWRSCIAAGAITEGNAWFDLLHARPVPPAVTASIAAADRAMLNQPYLDLVRGIACLSSGPRHLQDLDRALAALRFLGSDRLQSAARTAVAFHFAGGDVRARQILGEAVESVRGLANPKRSDIARAMVCLDLWASLGGADRDPALQSALKSWDAALHSTQLEVRSVPVLEMVRSSLRRNAQGKPKSILAPLEAMAKDQRAATTCQIEAKLLAGYALEAQGRLEEARRFWQQGVELLESRDIPSDEDSHPRLHIELVLRSLTGTWDGPSAAAWLTRFIGRTGPESGGGMWAAAIVQSLPGQGLADIFNAMPSSKKGRRFARDYALRNRSARDLALAGMELILEAMLRAGAALPAGHSLPLETAAQITDAFANGQLDEVDIMQVLTVWSGMKASAPWDILAAHWPASPRQSMVELLGWQIRTADPAAAAASVETGIGGAIGLD